MKKILLLAAFLSCSFFLFSQENKGLARVKRISGIEVYIYSEPLRDYEIAGTVNSSSTQETIDAINLGLKMLTNEDRAQDMKVYSMQDKIKAIANNALKKKKDKKKPIDFDAIIIDDDEKGVLIKFTE